MSTGKIYTFSWSLSIVEENVGRNPFSETDESHFIPAMTRLWADEY
jgi:hypothetical protein